MKKRIVFATGNAGKMKEIKMILGDLGMPVVSMKEAGIEADIVEDGTSFAENAQIKASAIFEKCHDLNNNLFELESFSLLKNENATLGDDGQSNTFEIS